MWNVRGLNKSGRSECIKNIIDTNKLDFVGLQETKNATFDVSFFNYINSSFSWNYLPADGTAGGILVGFRNSKFDIISWEINCFSISTIVKNTTDHVIWNLITVYGSAYDHGKQEFINELHTVLSGWAGPMIIGGDFNLTREAADKNNGNINFHWSDLFNNWINHWGLMELKNPTRSYTWTNNQDHPTMVVLDRVFISTNIDAQYPNINIRSAARLGSDHVPLLIDFGVDNRKKPYLFRFEKWWLSQEDLYHVVEKSWNSPCSLSDPLEVWQFKMKNLRRKLKG